MVAGVVPSSHRFLPSFFIAHRVQQIALLEDFSCVVASSRSRAFRKSICAQAKVPTITIERWMQMTWVGGNVSSNSVLLEEYTCTLL